MKEMAEKGYLELPDGMVRGYWGNIPKEELLKMLKEEIIRLGMEDNPNRTDYHEQYDNSKTPSPITYLNMFDCTWEELMVMIGIEYSSKEAWSKSGKMNKGMTGRGRWNSMTQEELLDVITKEIKEKDIRTSTEYVERVSKEDAPTYVTIASLVDGKWKTVKKAYRERYGIEIGGQISNR